jgi:branched-chain amino acid transport system ATP-binding protein
MVIKKRNKKKTRTKSKVKTKIKSKTKSKTKSKKKIMTQGRKFKIGKPILEVKNISLSFGGVKAITNISFDVLEHEIRALIGPNGAGKSSLLNCINGIYKPQEGKIILFPSWVEHSVLPNMTESTRISVSFNLSV